MSRIDRNDEWKVLVERPDLPFVLLGGPVGFGKSYFCLLYTSDAADE